MIVLNVTKMPEGFSYTVTRPGQGPATTMEAGEMVEWLRQLGVADPGHLVQHAEQYGAVVIPEYG